MNIIKKHQQNLPVNVKAIALDLGLRVYEVSGWPDNLCGKIVRDSQKGGKSGYAIFINRSHSDTRNRFTLAHEVAHFLLHKKEIGDGIADDALYRSKLSNHLEVIANQTAANILMPWDLIQQKISEGLHTVEQLAEVFNVSVSAMSIRLGVPSN